MTHTPLTEHSECIPRAGRLRQSVERQPSPFFAHAQRHAEQVAKSSGQAKRQHIHLTLIYLMKGLGWEEPE